jgi:hypothetical protein
MGWKTVFVLALLIAGGIGYFLWGTIQEAPKEATLPGYTNALKNDEQKAQAVASEANLKLITEAVGKYHSQKGSYPNSLQDLVPDFLDHVPGGFNYDSSTGTVSPVQ